MSSGHTGRGGRGNRRARRGGQRPRGPEGQNGQNGQNGQPHSSSAMLILSTGGRQTPAHPERERHLDDEDAVLDEGAEGDDEELSTTDEALSSSAVPLASEPESGDAAEEGDADAGDGVQPPQQNTLPQRPPAAPPGGGRGPHERSQPYAPGMRPHAPLLRSRGMATERSDGTVQSGDSYREPSAGEREALEPDGWQERDSSRQMPETPSRWTRAEQDDRGDHAPFRPEVRGEVGPLIDALRGLFEQDRAVASQGGTTRCGICYLHYALADLEYREEEGYYVCRACARSLGGTRLPMVRRQQHV